eukprot:GHRQ01001978.1.p1 GENE.GHRQ01001978.1~~GHRQ01001978.1.p1  ORF type:complete len:107 (-),score=9.42 GHRQ01001978.1:12-332(-)
MLSIVDINYVPLSLVAETTAHVMLSGSQVASFSGNTFTGSLPSLWARLTNMQLLDVANNGITGQLPPTYVSMQRLVVFDASNNKLTSTIPAHLTHAGQHLAHTELR